MELMDLDPVANDALYTPLVTSDAFRLMILQPGQRTDPVIVQIHTVSADSIPEYDAISYVWGDPGKTVLILCNGLPTKITVNLHAALVQVRSPTIPRVLWADALCINQMDKQERGQQVTIMGGIYSRARLVLACMGYSADGSIGPRVASFLAEYAHVMNTTKPPSHDSRWQSFPQLVSNDWFTRAWVLQEVGLARNPRVVYDNVDFSYRHLMGALRWLTLHGPGLAGGMGIPVLLIHIVWTDWSTNWAIDPTARECELLDLLDHGALLACRDPRDHIYAFLGHPLAVEAGGTGRVVVPDYEKPVGQVYKEATVFLLQQTGIRTLSSAEHTTDTLEDFTVPSWVLRWNVGSTMNNIHQHPLVSYQACGTRSISKLSLHGDILQVSGVQMDTLKEVYDIQYHLITYKITFTNQTTGRKSTLDELLSHISVTAPLYSDTEPQALALALGRTLCTNRVAEPEELDWTQAWNALKDSNGESVAASGAPLPYGDGVMVLLWHLIMSVSQGRALIVTEKGCLGLAPHCSRVGDACCVFDGGKVPFILRPRRSDSLNVMSQNDWDHRFVGEAYIHGLMHGETVGMLERGEAVERVFKMF